MSSMFSKGVVEANPMGAAKRRSVRVPARLAEAAERVRASAAWTSGPAPEVGLVLGSGLGAVAESLEDLRRVPYAKIPGMQSRKLEGHARNLVLGTLGGMPVVAMQGRLHLYEGHSPEEVVRGVRLMFVLGAETLVVTNAAGGIRRDLRAGDLMLIEDHLNLTGHNCLTGPGVVQMGPRFVDMSAAYDRSLRTLAIQRARKLGITLKRGTYAGVLGPSYETPAEIRMLRGLGADAVGMSTVLEVIAARHMGARCLGISCITNRAAGGTAQRLDHADVQETAAATAGRMSSLLSSMLRELKTKG